MCGFAGMLSFKRDLSGELDTIVAMTETLAKRGPDGEGYYNCKNALLGHRRLVVIDPAGGAQPMIKNIQGVQYVIIYNGELYNTEELRKLLIEKGFVFDSYSDTEVLLCSYIAWGKDCVNYINGIFAFAVWDEVNKRLFLCRDPLGVKPLYYCIRNDTLIFASELKAILTNPAVEPVLDETGICEVIGLGPAHALHSGVFKDVFQLAQAHWLLFSEDGIQLYEYWKLKIKPHAETEQQTQEHVRELLLDAIKRQLVSDVPVCTFLSGGLDSSIISAVAAEEFRKRGEVLKTFSIDYEENSRYYIKNDFIPTSDDEWINLMAEKIGSNHEKVIVNNKELVLALSDAVTANDLPGMADIDSSLLLFCREIRKKATVALSGECADEVFGGYPWFLNPEMANLNTFPWSNSVSARQNVLSPELRRIDLAAYVQAQYEDTIKRVVTEKPDAMKKLFYLNIKWFMNTLLTRKDRMSMANSLEVRVPFADFRLVEYAFSIPNEFLFFGGREKGLLRKALHGLLPEEILWRKKSPYPKTFNPEYSNLVQKWMRELLKDKDSRILNLLNIDVVKQIVESNGSSFGRPWFGQLMTGPQLIAYLIQLELWMRKYKVRLKI